METDNYNKEAQKALEELPETAMTKYMKLVIYIREKKLYEWSYDNALDFDEACKKLEEIVKLDEKYYKIAVNDGEISKEFMEYYDQGDWKLIKRIWRVKHHEETTDYIDCTAHTDTLCLCPTASGQ